MTQSNEIDKSTGGTEHTHYCRDCELELALMYDEREDESVPIVCAHCGGTNTETLVADGGTDTSGTDRYGNEVPPDLDGVDLRNSDHCPNCGDSKKAWMERPAGYYTCPECWSTWAGDPEDANIVDYVPHDNSSTETKQDGDRA